MDAALITAEASIARAIRDVLRMGAIRSVCQPIVSLTSGAVLGHEALTRPSASPPLDAPDEFLRRSRALGLLAEADRGWRQAAIERFSKAISDDELLFLNVSPLPLLSGEYRPAALLELVRRHGIQPERVVLELTEEESISDFQRIREALGAFRADGFLIAIDDAGAGQSSLQSVVELRPHFIKLDRWLTTEIANDRARQSMVEAITGFAHRMGARVVAEGIETFDELRTLIDLNVDFGQGYLIAEPAATPSNPAPEVRAFIERAASANRARRSISGASRTYEIAVVVPTVAAEAPGAALLELFRANDLLDAVVVMDGSVVVGIATRARVLLKFAVNLGHSVYSGRPARMLSTPATTVQSNETARAAARIALERPPGMQNDPLVVLDGTTFAGTVSVADLMRQILAIDLAEARTANPLTGLPGNTRIRERVETLDGNKVPWVFLYADIDNFKAFNDRYGFAAGDIAILRLASILVSVRDSCHHEAFVGHIGGDDFAMIVHEDDLQHVRSITREALAGRWFDPENNVAATSLSVTIGGAPLAVTEGLKYEERAAVVAQVKSVLKGRGGDCFVVFDELALIGDRAA
ncbi:MAG: EAL domain-containing protein [Tepidiformaceae bacterium]